MRECEALFLDSIAAAKRTIYIENQYFTNATLTAALTARLAEPTGPEVVIVAPRDSHGWLELKTIGAFRDNVFRRLIASDPHKRLRLVSPVASRARELPDLRPLEGDDCRRRAGSDWIGQLLTPLDGDGHGM